MPNLTFRTRDKTSPPAPGSGSTNGASREQLSEAIGRADSRTRLRLTLGISDPIELDLTAEQRDELRGQTLERAIDTVLERADQFEADAIRQTLRDPSSIVEMSTARGTRAARTSDRIDEYLGTEVLDIGISRPMRGGWVPY